MNIYIYNTVYIYIYKVLSQNIEEALIGLRGFQILRRSHL